ncbi:MAG: nicotinate phosphoribosyltransferase [Acidaminococcales bacterium]|jgi:nicotinate phosphoribosyltransferase|nr:nicotinate phosphoribosyltransferase [Acidaminococcales bacterium]
MRERLCATSFDIPYESIKSGFYTDAYFLRTAEILKAAKHRPTVLMQVFQRGHSVLCGVDEAIAVLKTCAGGPLKIKALYDGDEIEPWETVMSIEGDLADFAYLETIYLGILARQSKIATNVRRAVEAAGGKTVLFFGARYDHYLMQKGDGHAIKIGGGIGVSTDANGLLGGKKGLGTIPHALIAAFGGDTAKATRAFDQYIDKTVNRTALVDFDNDCVNASLAVAHELKERLFAVRLDTSGNLVDKSIIPKMGAFMPNGVCAELAQNVRAALDKEGFSHVKIMVSGGFTAEKIADFEKNGVPVDIYAVGSAFYDKNINFTADVVLANGRPAAKAGRSYRPNPRLEEVT